VPTSDSHSVIQNLDVSYSFCTSDHVSTRTGVSLEPMTQVEGSSTQGCKKISWDNFNCGCIIGYNLENVNSATDARMTAINVLYDNIIESMTNASNELISQQGRIVLLENAL